MIPGPQRNHPFEREQPPQQLAPAMNVRPGPFNFAVGSRMVGNQKLVVLHLETTTGSCICPILPEVAAQIARQLLRHAGGIEIARQVP